MYDSQLPAINAYRHLFDWGINRFDVRQLSQQETDLAYLLDIKSRKEKEKRADFLVCISATFTTHKTRIVLNALRHPPASFLPALLLISFCPWDRYDWNDFQFNLEYHCRPFLRPSQRPRDSSECNRSPAFALRASNRNPCLTKTSNGSRTRSNAHERRRSLLARTSPTKPL